MENQKKIGKTRNKTHPNPVFYWTTEDVLKWYKSQCKQYLKYFDLFEKEKVNGRSLLRMNDYSLERMGIDNPQEREIIFSKIDKLQSNE